VGDAMRLHKRGNSRNQYARERAKNQFVALVERTRSTSGHSRSRREGPAVADDGLGSPSCTSPTRQPEKRPLMPIDPCPSLALRACGMRPALWSQRLEPAYPLAFGPHAEPYGDYSASC
jgi:hypothetical protein